ncbi:DDHD domain protein [Gregarina niphandrodes]|uniref:DDHD domain protein n=1 Tax=Gregarina niphandrodes TaxID=110365 RepID=A0A023BAM5_GRENI|nr:DDHD domain protein [Gregarina niphandrodes]EZG78306.1 DDHD domain protein [Gregarina niphandrodes]|eukprot:XP_011129344.1 DDHD domain protein [Gregarina niphandrodes]
MGKKEDPRKKDDKRKKEDKGKKGIQESERSGFFGRRGRRASEMKLEPEDVREFKELQKRHGLRVYFSNTVVDVMFYLTPRYGGYMATQVGRLLNQRVRDLRTSACGRFRHSEIVLVGHSLGSVLLYELLSGRPLRAQLWDSVDADDVSLFPDQTLPAKPDCAGATLDFDVNHVFLWGSPLSSFLVLKNDKSLTPAGPLSLGRHRHTRIYNIFHRSDPIATRIEPVFYRDKDYIPPAIRLPSY